MDCRGGIVMKTDSLQDMVKDYERRTGEKVSFDGFFFDEGNHFRDDNFQYFNFFPNEGFIFWGINEEHGERVFSILQTYGNMKVIGKFIVDVMDKNNLDTIVTATARKSVNGFVKKWDMKRLPAYDYTYYGKDYKVLITNKESLERTL